MNDITPMDQASNATAVSSYGSATSIEEQRAIAEVKAMLTAAAYMPRDVKGVIRKFAVTCERRSFAEKSMYEFSRGGTAITGPSIRFAEALIREWGNVDYGWRVLEMREASSVILCYAWDTQANVRRILQFENPHKRTGKNQAILKDPRDIYENDANQAMRRLRACLLGLLPADIVEEGLEACQKTIQASFDGAPETIKKLTDAFRDQFGVTQDQIEARIQRHIGAMTAGNYVSLRNIFVSLRDGMSTPETWFKEVEVEQAPTEEQRVLSGGFTDTKKPKAPKAAQAPAKAQPAAKKELDPEAGPEPEQEVELETQDEEPEPKQAAPATPTIGNAISWPALKTAVAAALREFGETLEDQDKIRELAFDRARYLAENEHDDVPSITVDAQMFSMFLSSKPTKASAISAWGNFIRSQAYADLKEDNRKALADRMQALN